MFPGLGKLHIRNLRILAEAEIAPCPALNVLSGSNGAGKTSVLESVDFLSRGRSFRTRRLDDLLRTGQEEILVSGELGAEEPLRLGISKNAAGLKLRVQGEDVRSIAELAAHLPVRSLHPASQELILGSPSLRREFLDWGLFHVKPSFYPVWRRYQRALEQTNAALKGGGAGLNGWHQVLAEEGEVVSEMRKTYLAELMPHIRQQLDRVLEVDLLDIRYRQGWSEGEPLDTALQKAVRQDLQRGFTSNGPHRGDLDIGWDVKPASQVGSRGQLKLIVSALTLAQLAYFQHSARRGAILLIDELPAELDAPARGRLLEALKDLRTQVFVSAIDPSLVDSRGWTSVKRFHVERGHISEML